MSQVLVDPRIGSGDLLAPLQALGCPAKHEYLPFGDVQMVGKGPEDRPVLIGIEIKAIGDLLRCITDKRFVGGQLGGLLSGYEQAFLLIEGIMTAGPTRELKILKSERPSNGWNPVPFGARTWKYEDVASWTHSVRRAGVQIAQTADRRGTAAWIASLYSNWQKPWESHKTLLGRLQKPMEAGPNNALAELEATPPMGVAGNLARGIGWEKATAAAKHFRSIRRMVNAGPADWLQVPGIGKKLAAEAVATAEREY